ncbi:hypothetical protein CRYUN_Cryun31cG0031700 [Craigia yunnanensis]
MRRRKLKISGSKLPLPKLCIGNQKFWVGNKQLKPLHLQRRSYCRYQGRRKYRTSEPQEYDDNEDANGNVSRDSSSADEHHSRTEHLLAPQKGFTQEQHLVASQKGFTEEQVACAVTQYGSLSGGNGKNAQNIRICKLVDRLRNLKEKGDELDIHLMLVSVDEQRIPSLQRPFLSCGPTLLVRQLCQAIILPPESFCSFNNSLLQFKTLDN